MNGNNRAHFRASSLKTLTILDRLVQKVRTEKRSGTIQQIHVGDEIDILPLKAGPELASLSARRVFDAATY